jgi:hypothetical protein
MYLKDSKDAVLQKEVELTQQCLMVNPKECKPVFLQQLSLPAKQIMGTVAATYY